jgi:deoxyribonuclease-1-like protein
MQELRDTEVLDRAVAVLDLLFDKSYEYVASPPVGRGVKERYAFFYNADKVFWKDVSFTVADPEDQFIREPFGALFQAGAFDFYAVTVHSIFGDSIRLRRAEAALLDDVYRAVQDRDGENDVLLLGDFNLPPEDDGFAELRTVTGIFPLNSTRPTTIRDSLYDNIWMQSQYCGEFTGDWGVFSFDELLYGNDDKAASLAVSDHRPLWARFDTAGPDDD